MLPAELLKEIRRIEISSRRSVNTLFSGEYKSVFKGRGMEFAEVREYIPGDDVRAIDWNVTARMGRPFVKRFIEERELTVMLAVDRSGSGEFGSQNNLKGELAARICALLAFSATQNNDKVGLIIFTDQIELYIPPKKGRRHALRVIREILAFRPVSRGTNIASALDFLNRVMRRTAIVFLVSDFLDHGYEKSLLFAGKKHDLIPITLTDPREKELPPCGLIRLKDAETGAVRVVDAANPILRERFAERAETQAKARDRLFRSLNLDFMNLSTDASYLDPLTAFFRRRSARLRRQGGA